MASQHDGHRVALRPTALARMGTVASQTSALILLCLSQFMLVLDVAIVNVALPVIQRDLAFTRGDLQLVVTAYALTFGCLLLLGGRAADAFGRRRMFMLGAALFTGGSLLCGLAQSAAMLVIARILQGVGGALVAPAALALLTTIFTDPAARSRALAVWSALAAGGGAAGLLLGGVLTDLASWRWVFLVNVPVGAVILLGAVRLLPEGAPRGKQRIDVAGAATVTAGLFALVFGLGRLGLAGGAAGSIISLLMIASGFLLAFVVIERRVREPLLPFGIFRLPNVAGANGVTLLMSGVILGVNYFLTLYFQQVLGYSPLVTGLAFLPITIVSAAASGLVAQWLNRLGVRALLVGGMVALAAGSALLLRIAPQGSYILDIAPGIVLIAIGLGIGFTVGTLAAVSGVDDAQEGIASGILSTSQQLGGALGLAVLTVVANATTRVATGATSQALTAGFRAAFIVMMGLGLAATLVAALYVRDLVAEEQPLTAPSEQ